jgi:hypothetical protein
MRLCGNQSFTARFLHFYQIEREAFGVMTLFLHWNLGLSKDIRRGERRLNRKNLPRSPPRLPPTNNLFGSLPELDVAHATREVERAEVLVDIILDGRDAAEHQCLAILRY